MKQFLSLLLPLCMLCTFLLPAAAAEAAPAEDMNPREYGLHVEDGVLTLEGQPFYGFGVNYFGAFTHYAEGGLPDPQTFKDGFAGMAAHNIPYVRMALGYWPTFYAQYDSDPQGVLAMIREVLDAAEEARVGVILSLFWYDFALPEHVGEHRADMGEADSRTVAYAVEFTTAIVKEFAGHRALWGWEIGNEYNLSADLCDRSLQGFLPGAGLPGFRDDANTARDYLTSGEAAFFFETVASTIRRYDGYRIISNGCSEMRTSAWHMHKATARLRDNHLWDVNWSQDTREEFNKAVAFYTPDSVDTVSFHFQSGTAGAEDPSYTTSYPVFAGESALTVPQFLASYVDAARAAGKALFLGEFGDFRDMESAEDCPEMFRTLCGWVADSGIQTAALWQFQDYNDSGVGAEKLDILSELNAALKVEGKLYTDVAWGLAEDPADKETEAPTAAATSDTPAASDPTAATEAPAASEGNATEAPATEAPARGGCGSALSPMAPILPCAALPLLLRGSGRKPRRREQEQKE